MSSPPKHATNAKGRALLWDPYVLVTMSLTSEGGGVKSNVCLLFRGNNPFNSGEKRCGDETNVETAVLYVIDLHI